MKLPIGIQTFGEIRMEGYVYVDKTAHIHQVVNSGKYFFLARPRRFGKSLMLSTLKALHTGQRELFEGLWIEKRWDWSKIYPIIHISFSSIGYRELGLEAAIEQQLEILAAQYDIPLPQKGFSQKFKALIQQLSTRNKVVLLIDEYDKPIIDYLEDLPQARENRAILKTFYSVLKDSDPYIKLLFITGVSRFAKTSIFSDLNNLTNLSIHPLSSVLLGITQQELELIFANEINLIANQQGITPEILKERIKTWYNGYSWDGQQHVYNPFSLLSFFLSKQFKNFWFATGTPTFLGKLMRKNLEYRIEETMVSDANLSSYDLEALNPITILFQTGYLTIKEQVDDNIYVLGYPNFEVKTSLEEHLINAYAHDEVQTARVKTLQMARAFKEGDLARVVNIINATFASIPNQLWQKENEAFYHALIHLTFSLMGVYVQSEINSANGRLDAKVETENTIYILEFKLDQSVDIALKQISEKRYFGAYKDVSKQKIGVGINFSTQQKAIENWQSQIF
ncbi:MAG: AAA family ATPase [Bacteroidota bacterium]